MQQITNIFSITYNEISIIKNILINEYNNKNQLKILHREDKVRFKQEIAYIKDNHPCSTNTLNSLAQVINNLKTKQFANILTHEFYNPLVMENAQCLLETIFYTSPWGDTFTAEERERLHLKNVMLISDNTSSSTAYIAKYNNKQDFKIVIKQGFNNYNTLALGHEAFIGLYAINKLRTLCPNFMYTYGLVHENRFINRSDTYTRLLKSERNKTIAYLDQENKKTYHILLESINNSISLKKYIDICTDDDFVDIFMQIVYALEIAQHQINFTHYDLHSDNILVKKLDKNSQIVYHRPNGQKRYVTSNYLAVIIDFGYSHVKINDQDYGITINKVQGVDNTFHPLKDIYKLLGYSSIAYFNKLKLTKKIDEKTEFILKNTWSIFNPTQNWKKAVIQNNNSKYVYYKEVDKNAHIYSDFIDLFESKIGNLFDNSLQFTSLDCNNNKCYSSEEIWQIENLNTSVTIPKDIVSMYDLYTYLNNNNQKEIAEDILNQFIKTDNFTQSYNKSFNHVEELLLEADNQQNYYFSTKLDFNRNDLIRNPNIYNNIIFQYLEYIHLLNEIKFNIFILEKFVPENQKQQISYQNVFNVTKQMSVFLNELYSNFITFDYFEQNQNQFIKQNLILIKNLSQL